MSLRRLVAVILQCALIAMPMISGAIRCDGDGHAAHMDMAGMQTPGMPMGGHESPEHRDSSSDCSLPWAPGPCESMSSCAMPVMNVEPVSVVAAGSLGDDRPIVQERDSHSVTRAPETPPPRA